MSLQYEPSLELLLISAKPLFSNRELHRFLDMASVRTYGEGGSYERGTLLWTADFVLGRPRPP